MIKRVSPNFKFITTVLLACCSACKINRVRDGARVGKWIERDTINAVAYKSIGRYRRDFEKGTWRKYADGQLIKKEIYGDSICHVLNYNNNGNISREGYTRLRVSGKETHWFYFGDWLSYDENGKLQSVDTYYEGELVGEKDIAP
jgi:antitoxin component YwqK of YwqJK toxin-antitoxin module